LISAGENDSAQPLRFAMSMGVRKGDESLRTQLEAEITRRQKEIRKLLTSYGVPMVDTQSNSRSRQ
jgi:hypothetical protein